MIVKFKGQEYTLEGVNDSVWIERDKKEEERGGIILPDAAQKNPHTGDIKAVGKLVQDSKISTDKKAVFNPTGGQPIKFDDIELTVLHAMEVTAVLTKK